MEMDCQFISIYGKFVTSLTAYFSWADINNTGAGLIVCGRKVHPASLSAEYTNAGFYVHFKTCMYLTVIVCYFVLNKWDETSITGVGVETNWDGHPGDVW